MLKPLSQLYNNTMENILRTVPTIKLNDLQVSLDFGWAFQEHVQEYNYGESYWQNYINIEDTPTANLLNEFRSNIAEKYADSILDMGIGSGAFLKALKSNKYGYDVNPYAIEWLKEQKIYHDPYNSENEEINGFCCWDVIEHMQNPSEFLAIIPPKAHLFISLPVFTDLEMVHLSKHYKPNEHLFYFTTKGMIKFLEISGFTIKELRSDETQIGREKIMTFVSQKNHDR